MASPRAIASTRGCFLVPTSESCCAKLDRCFATSLLVLNLQPLDRRLHCSLQNSLIQHVRESSQHRLIERLLLELDRIRGAGHAIDEQRVRESLNSFLGPCPQYYNFSYYDGSTCDKY
jgi:hypothetical protein